MSDSDDSFQSCLSKDEMCDCNDFDETVEKCRLETKDFVEDPPTVPRFTLSWKQLHAVVCDQDFLLDSIADSVSRIVSLVELDNSMNYKVRRKSLANNS